MPNGGSWDRFWFVLLGFRGAYGRWPTRLVVPEVVREALVAHLSSSDMAKVADKLEIVVGDDLIAYDASGAEFRYNGPPEKSPSEDPQDWLGVRWV